MTTVKKPQIPKAINDTKESYKQFTIQQPEQSQIAFDNNMFGCVVVYHNSPRKYFVHWNFCHKDEKVGQQRQNGEIIHWIDPRTNNKTPLK